VISTRDRVFAFYRRLPPYTGPLLLILLVVLAGNGMYVFRLANNDPISWTAGISHKLCRITCGRPAIDPNLGFITQALGHTAAMDILHGHFPWWNSFEGLGQPLLGEMQSAAFLPLTLFFALPSGLVWFHISLELIAGFSTYFLARRLSLPVFFATFAGMLFALNGTYAWLGNAVLNPVAFLPMLLLGIEMILDSGTSATKRGWYIAAIALALSMYAGFPEVAYSDGLFCAAWAIVRLFSLPRAQRPRVLRRLGLGGVMGIVLSLPVLVPFDDFLKAAFVGSHTAALDGVIRLPKESISGFFDPYVFGTIFSNTNVDSFWGEIGGYFGAGVCVLALVGLFGPRLRPLRIFLAAWTLAGLAGALDLLHSRTIWNLIPLVNTSSFPRYIMPSCEIAVIVLAAFGMADYTTSTRSKRLFTTASIAMVLVLLWSVNEARSYNKGVVLSGRADIILIGVACIPWIAIGLLLILGRFHKYRVTPYLIALVIVGESFLYFFVPTAESPKRITLDEAPIHFLQKNLHKERYLDFAVLYPNWGSYFDVNSLSSIDLPYPKAMKNFIEDQLYPGLDPGNQFVVKGGMVGVEALEAEVVKHFKAYENASVKYLLIPSSVIINPKLTALGVKQVFKDSLATIYQMPYTRPFFTTSSSSCAVHSTGNNFATVNCPSGGATLLRTELSMKGWTASVNGKSVTITTVDGVYQRISLPAGTSSVEYKFFPPHERYALLLGFLGGLFLIGSFLDERWRFFPSRRRPRTRFLPPRDATGSSTLTEKGAGPVESPVEPNVT
jgi:hypothetical protein